MRIHVTSRHARLTPAVRRYLDERLSRIERFAPAGEAHVILDVQKSRHVTEIVVRLKGRELVAREESHEAMASIDAAIDSSSAARGRRRSREMVLKDGTRLWRRQGGRGALGRRAMLATGRAARKRADEEEAARRPRIVPARGMPGRPVTLDEAADELWPTGSRVPRLRQLGHRPDERALQAQGRQPRAHRGPHARGARCRSERNRDDAEPVAARLFEEQRGDLGSDPDRDGSSPGARSPSPTCTARA